MCVNKVYVGDILKGFRHANFFNCGKCKACRQSRAFKRATRIRYHNPKGFRHYFVTLTYDNQHIPYFKKSDFYDAFIDNSLKKLKDNTFNLPIYRDSKLLHSGAFSFGSTCIDQIPFDFNKVTVTEKSIDSLSGLRTLLSRKPLKFHVDDNKISLAYNSDVKDFFKRLRNIIKRTYSENFRLSYFYAPEYGPDSQRFHIHLRLSCSSNVSYYNLREAVVKAWPFCDSSLFYKTQRSAFQAERNLSNYLASYINNSADVSQLLQDISPLRPTHSLYYGFDENIFGFQKVLSAYQNNRSFTYTAKVVKHGVLQDVSLPYPKYIISRYFPRIKGFNQFDRFTRIYAYAYPHKYLKKISDVAAGFTPSEEPLYNTNLFSRYGTSIPFTDAELSYHYYNVIKVYNQFYKPLGFSVLDYAIMVDDYHAALSTWRYKESQQYDNELDNLYQFFNSSVPLIREFYGLDYPELEDCNKFPEEIQLTEELEKRFDENIKTRKINNYSSI